MKEVHIVISGIVQGVFFRSSIDQQAKQHRITGWVRNTQQNTVEAVFQGESENVNAIIEWCKKGPENAQVTNIVINDQPLTAPYPDFRIVL